jgi:CO dehydrogenase/acetyl-CoA synthase alpha subunit
MIEDPTPIPDIADFRVWENRLLKGYSPEHFNIILR